MPKEYRLVLRNSLAMLETAVRELESVKWDLHREAVSISLVQALDDCKLYKPISVAMCREKVDPS